MSEGQDRTAETAPGPSTPTLPGPPPTYLDPRQRADMLALVKSGKGRDQALDTIGATYRAYRNTINAEPEFREEVEHARRVASQVLDEMGWIVAQSDSDVLIKLLERRDKARTLNYARGDRAKERAQDEARREKERAEDREMERARMALQLRLAEMAAEARAKEREGNRDTDGELDLTPLSDEDRDKLRELLGRVLGQDDGMGP